MNSLTIIVSLLIANTTMNNPIISELETQQKLWQSHQMTNYQYIYTKRCFCPPPANIPSKISVRDQQIISVTNLQTGEVSNQPDLTIYKSVDQLFAIIEEAVQRHAHKIVVEYDPELGYPTHIFIDYIQLAVDDEVDYSVSDLAITKP